MKPVFRIFALMLMVFLFSCHKSATKQNELIAIEDALVKNNEIAGWTYAGQRWVANNVSELTTYINGQAEIYQRHGFVEAANQSYEGKIDGANRQLQLTVYNQGSEANAQALFNDPDLQLTGGLVWTGGAGKEARYFRFGGLSQVMAFYRNSYFVYLQINYDTEESLNILKQFALNVDQKIK